MARFSPAVLLALALALSACATAPDGEPGRFQGGYGGVTTGGATGR